MKIMDKVVLVTGSNRGIGKALVEEALKRGVKQVYAAARQPLTHSDKRVISLTLDVTSAAQIQEATEKVDSLDLLINNAGLGLYDDLSDGTLLEQHLNVNLFGTYKMIQAFLPLLIRSGGAVVNISSIAAFAAVPVMPAYSVSKAAMFSLTQSFRALLAAQGVRVHAVMAGPVDTDMTQALNITKATPEAVACAVFDGVENGEEEIFPDSMSEPMAEAWRSGVVKALERQNAALIPANGVA
jgi:NAD(P)-dependent dehydrogenase (short-subunit alcohol dehydrogenase family)